MARESRINYDSKKENKVDDGIPVTAGESVLRNMEEMNKQRQAELTRGESELLEAQKKLEKEKENLRSREKSIQEAEIRRDQGYTDERKKLDEEIYNKRKMLEDELNKRRSREMQEMSERISADEKKRLGQLEKELAEKRNEVENKLKELKEVGEEQTQQSARLEKKEIELQLQETDIKQKILVIEDEVKRRTSEREKSFQSEIAGNKKENERLRDDLRATKEMLDLYDDLKRKLGDEPEKVLLQLKSYEEQMKELKNELLERPSKEMLSTIDGLNKEVESLKQALTHLSEENQTLKSAVHAGSMKEFDKTELEDEKRRLESRNKCLEIEVNQLRDDIERMRSSYERTKDRDARIKDIEKPFFSDIKERAKTKTEEIRTEDNKKRKVEVLVKEDGAGKTTEIEWLDGIMKKCSEYGLKFPKRILYAYHTALKTAEWSPLTVLAGVSGTGKSELPKLYAHFGGLNFLNVSVQPNWDSQESMLGFFNSIDNRFDAQSVLRLLAQTQTEKSDNYPGLNDVMTLILLDEMNLAHIELYFAEFLSKLESRRGKPEDTAEFIEVKLGSGLEPYKLSLGRNVLWTGTINQDETTKSLSDKVLDRGIIISFPRPTELQRRINLNPLGKEGFSAAPLLSKNVWRFWRTLKSPFTDDEIRPYKGFVEEMNNSLSKVSRALGHRVWQSVEYYMANYPEVSKAKADNDTSALKSLMRIAFEDQLVQKIMPKLRGIETRGTAKTGCLDKIRAQLVRDNYIIVDDFDQACEFGHGQFIWNSANYLKEENSPLSDKPGEENSLNKG